MRDRIRFLGLGLCYLLAGCGESASPNSPAPGATGLQPVMDKVLHLTNASVFDSNGAFVDVICGDAANPCQWDDVVFTGSGEFIVQECNDCSLDDPENERATWSFDEARNEVTIFDNTPAPDLTYGIVAVSDDSITLEIPTEELMDAIFHQASAGGAPSDSASTVAKGTSTRLTFAGG